MWSSDFAAVDFRNSRSGLLGRTAYRKAKVAEEVWEPPVEIENSEAETEEAENAETSTESAYWFIPQASDDLLQKRRRSNCRVRFCQQQNRSENL